MAVSYNTTGDLRSVIDGMVSKLVVQIAHRLRRGQSTSELDKKLASLWLLRQASAYFSVEDIDRAFTSLTLYSNV